jgi:predicted phage terminase large subunit-like protein
MNPKQRLVRLEALEAAHRSKLPVAPSEPVRLTLAEYVERVKRITLDAWQIDLCARLEDAFRTPGKRVAIAAFPQAGKSIIISQCQPAWIFGQDPTHRFRLATYNIMHSARFSRVVQNIIRSPEHRAIFRDKAGHIPERTKFQEWSTYARAEVNDGQASFAGLGLRSGFVGTGADTLVIDDPYKSAEEAYSLTIRDSTWRFWEDTARPRMTERGNVFIMFHRYHQDDMGGRAVASGEFDLWRYAAESDGDYEDEETGLVFPDPIGRTEGEYLSPRFSAGYYAKQKQNVTVWNSQFQGRPTSKSGGMFDVTRLEEVEASTLPPMVHVVRAWDNAATEGAGAYTAGIKLGMDATGKVYVLDVVREQVGTAERQVLAQMTAQRDGKLVAIHAPQDPGSAGKDVAFQFEQMLREYQVTTAPVSGSKEMRAYAFSLAVGSDNVRMLKADWNKDFRNEFKNFPVGTFKDQVDAGSDAYNHLYKLFHRGLVIKSFTAPVNLVGWSSFAKRFGQSQIPAHWEVSAGIRLEADASKPSGWAIVARAAENAGLGECVFVVASARRFTAHADSLVSELKSALERACAKGVGHADTIWLSRESLDITQVASEKHDLTLTRFAEDASAGLSETNWYFQQVNALHPFGKRTLASHCYLLVDERQMDAPVDDGGLLSTRQELISWAYNEQGAPQPYGGVTLDCIRMTLYDFALSATAMTRDEKRIAKLSDELKPSEVIKHLGTPAYVELRSAQQHELAQIKIQEEREDAAFTKGWSKLQRRPFKRKFNR